MLLVVNPDKASLAARPGRAAPKVVLTGGIGAGKSTVVQAVLNAATATSGSQKGNLLTSLPVCRQNIRKNIATTQLRHPPSGLGNFPQMKGNSNAQLRA